MKPIILLTGQPGIGKSTIIKALIDYLSDNQISHGGFFTREIRHPQTHQRTGFEIVTLPGRQTASLATTELNTIKNGVPFGKYTIDPTAIEDVALPAVTSAQERGAIVIIDEIGPMEIVSSAFCDAVWALLANENVTVVGTVVERPYRFADDVKRHRRVRVVEVTLENRDRLVEEMVVTLEVG